MTMFLISLGSLTAFGAGSFFGVLLLLNQLDHIQLVDLDVPSDDR